MFGTRPEAIKLAPLIAATRDSTRLEPVVCVTAQHRELLDQVLGFYGIFPEADLDLMQAGQPLTGFAARALREVGGWLEGQDLSALVVQGDTTTTCMASLAAFHRQVPVGHVEAGLRTGHRYEPFPEEMNRRIVSCLADLHFAPTERAVANLVAEGHRRATIHLTGNTVVDAVHHVRRLIGAGRLLMPVPRRRGERILTLTTHRRENFGAPLQRICHAVVSILQRNPSVRVVIPAHPNPNVRPVLVERLGGLDRVWIIDPPMYLDFVALLMNSDIVLTDSGGVQEEAPILGKPTLVLREITERSEGVEAGASILVGTDPSRIVREVERLLDEPDYYARYSQERSPYGDGHAAPRIVRILQTALDATDHVAVRASPRARVAS